MIGLFFVQPKYPTKNTVEKCSKMLSSTSSNNMQHILTASNKGPMHSLLVPQKQQRKLNYGCNHLKVLNFRSTRHTLHHHCCRLSDSVSFRVEIQKACATMCKTLIIVKVSVHQKQKDIKTIAEKTDIPKCASERIQTWKT